MPTCEGDAVQCAQARYAFELDCKFKTASDGTEQLGRDVVAGHDPMAGQNPALESNRTHVDISALLAGSVTETFAAQCLPDLHLVVSGRSVTIPLADACNWLTIAGNVGVMASLFLGMLIVGKGN